MSSVQPMSHPTLYDSLRKGVKPAHIFTLVRRVFITATKLNFLSLKQCRDLIAGDVQTSFLIAKVETFSQYHLQSFGVLSMYNFHKVST